MPTEDGKPLNEFQRPQSVPPGGVFFYELDVVGTVLIRFESYKNVEDLVWQIESYCDLNKLETPVFLKAKILEFMCDNLPPGFCRESSYNVKRSITMNQVKDFTRLLFSKALRLTPGGFLATKEVAEARAKICSEGPDGKGCPLNDRTKCTVCGGLLSLIRKLVGRRETSFDPGLGTCALCGCLLRAKVHVSSEALKAATTKPPEESIPNFCWLRGVYGK